LKKIKGFLSENLHKYGAYLCLILFSKWKRGLFIGGGTLLVLLSLWWMRLNWCASHFLAQGERYIKEERLQEATESLHKALNLNPRLLDAYLHLARIYLNEDKPSLAVNELLKATKFFPENPVLLATLKKSYERETLHSSQILKVGIRSELNPLTTLKATEPLLSYLSRNLKCRIALVLLPTCGSVNQFLKEGKVDIAILGPENLTRTEYKSEAIPLVLISSNKQYVQRSIIVTRKKDIRSIKDLKGKNFAFARKSSITGHILPQIILSEEGIDPEKDFANVYFMKSQEQVLLSLLEGKVEAGALAEHIFHYLTSTFPVSGEVDILARSDEIPANILIARKNISSKLIVNIKTLLLKYSESNSSNKGIFSECTGINIKEDNTQEGKTYTVILAGL